MSNLTHKKFIEGSYLLGSKDMGEQNIDISYLDPLCIVVHPTTDSEDSWHILDLTIDRPTWDYFPNLAVDANPEFRVPSSYLRKEVDKFIGWRAENKDERLVECVGNKDLDGLSECITRAVTEQGMDFHPVFRFSFYSLYAHYVSRFPSLVGCYPELMKRYQEAP